jgi:hypothetical protein
MAAPYVNYGEMQNRGYDISVAYHTGKNAKLNWKSTLIFSQYRNTVKALNSQTSSLVQTLAVNGNPPITKTMVGQPVGLFYGYEMAGIFQTVDQLYASPIKAGNDRNPKNGTYLGDIQFKDNNKSGDIEGEDQ